MKLPLFSSSKDNLSKLKKEGEEGQKNLNCRVELWENHGMGGDWGLNSFSLKCGDLIWFWMWWF